MGEFVHDATSETLVAVPEENVLGVALSVHAGGAWHACQFPAAATHAASVAGTPLEVKLLPQRLLWPLSKEAGGAGTGPVNRLLLTRNNCNAVNPLSEGMGPVSWLLLTINCCNAVDPLSEGMDPVNWLLKA